MQGSVWQLEKEGGVGVILGEHGCEVFFNRPGLNGAGISELEVGQWVEYDLETGAGRLWAVNIKVLCGRPGSKDTAGANRDNRREIP